MARLRKNKPIRQAQKIRKKTSKRCKRGHKPSSTLKFLKPLLGAGILTSVVYYSTILYHDGWFDRQMAAFSQSILETTQHAGFQVKNVFVKGRHRTDKLELVDAIGIIEGEPLFAFDLEIIQERVKSLPWVKRATVERHLPNTLYVRLEERQPLALWQRGDDLFLIDTTGTVIPYQNVEDYADLFMVVGEGANTNAHTLIALLSEAPDLQSRVVTGIRVGKRRWNLLIDNGIFVNLPEANPHEAFLELAELQKKYNILQRDIRVIDMRLSDRLILQLEQEKAKRFEQKT